MKKLIIILSLLPALAWAQTDKEKAETAPPVFMVVEQMPTFPGGDDAMLKFLGRNIRYPSLAKECGCQGTVYMSFIVDEEGSLVDAKIIRKLPTCVGTINTDKDGNVVNAGSKDSYEVPCSKGTELMEKEAIRVVNSMPKWTPGMQNGKPVRVQYNLPVKFTLR